MVFPKPVWSTKTVATLVLKLRETCCSAPWVTSDPSFNDRSPKPWKMMEKDGNKWKWMEIRSTISLIWLTVYNLIRTNGHQANRNFVPVGDGSTFQDQQTLWSFRRLIRHCRQNLSNQQIYWAPTRQWMWEMPGAVETDGFDSGPQIDTLLLKPLTRPSVLRANLHPVAF